MLELFADLDRLPPAVSRVAMATLVATSGTTPRKQGAHMLVGEGGAILGSVTIGGCVDARVIEEAERCLADGRPRLVRADARRRGCVGDRALVRRNRRSAGGTTRARPGQ